MDLISVSTHLGRFYLAAEGAYITRLYLPNAPVPRIALRETPALVQARQQLLAYLEGERTAFSLSLSPHGGTDFQRAVWKALKDIPYGETRTYGEIAVSVGHPKAARAVGQANHCNPIPIFIPCHRVVGAGGKLTGYAGGTDLKEGLLNLERGKEGTHAR